MIGLYELGLTVVLGYTVLGWLTLTGIKLNYGRLSNSLVNIYISPRIGWFLFEIPNLLWAVYFLGFKGDSCSLAYFLFILHYVNRDIIYPLRLKSKTKVGLEILLSAMTFTMANGYLQGVANQESERRTMLAKMGGVIVFGLGMAVNIYSDHILQATKLKLSTETRQYTRIDQFLFRFVGSPNYLGQIIEWLGYAIVSGHHCAWLFAFSTLNVLTPAAIVRNRWNKANLPNYPADRKAIFPFLL